MKGADAVRHYLPCVKEACVPSTKRASAEQQASLTHSKYHEEMKGPVAKSLNGQLVLNNCIGSFLFFQSIQFTLQQKMSWKKMTTVKTRRLGVCCNVQFEKGKNGLRDKLFLFSSDRTSSRRPSWWEGFYLSAFARSQKYCLMTSFVPTETVLCRKPFPLGAEGLRLGDCRITK